MPTKYTYDDAEYWLQYLSPAEITFLILFSYQECQNTYGEALFKVSFVEGDKEANIGGDDEEYGSLEVFVGFNEDCYVQVEGNFTVNSWYTHATWNEPAEGETNLRDVEIDKITLGFPNLDEEYEDSWIGQDSYRISSSEIKSGDSITYQNILWYADACLCCHIPADDVRREGDPKGFIKDVPPALISKIEKVRQENEKSIRNRKISKKFNI